MFGGLKREQNFFVGRQRFEHWMPTGHGSWSSTVSAIPGAKPLGSSHLTLKPFHTNDSKLVAG